MRKGAVLVELDGESYIVPERELAAYKLPVAEIVPAILGSLGVSPQEAGGSNLDEVLASWRNPVVAFLPEHEDADSTARDK